MWNPGDRLRHRFNADLGPGRVLVVDGRSLAVEFPDSNQVLQFSIRSDALEPLAFVAGGRARVEASDEMVVIAEVREDTCLLNDGREMLLDKLWPLAQERSPIDRLRDGKVDAPEDFRNRLDGLRLRRLREAGGLGSFLGGRVRLFPHQLYAAEKACRTEPVRWLLADEVGLGKTVEACLIMNRLIHTGRAERVLVVVPESLTVQWLGELWRKYHQIFVLIDKERLDDIILEHGEDFNPFEVHRRMIISLERLRSDRKLTEAAAAAGIDLLVIDEAHHLRRPEGEKGNAAWRSVAPIAALGRHMLLLTATPLEEDAFGFLRLLQLLRPDAYPEDESFEQRLARREPLPACTSSTRRSDIGGLPPRRGVPIEIDDAGWDALLEMELAMRLRPAEHAPARRRKARRIRRALASSDALMAVLDRSDQEGRELTRGARVEDPRLRWLAEEAQGWRQRREKTLIFTAHRETQNLVAEALEKRVEVALFHDELSPQRRDIEVARFRLPDGPAVLVSDESGGEGRNFEFCHRLVLFDLPWNPATVEQRIGRLDRIGRTRPTDIVYFLPPRGYGRAIAQLYEEIGLFREPLGALARELKAVADEIERVVLDGEFNDDLGAEVFREVLNEARAAHGRMREAAYQELHREPYEASMAESILDRVPAELDSLIEDLVLRASARFGFTIEPEPSQNAWMVELGAEALVDRLSGVQPGARFLGTFDREQAVRNEEIEFFASGHALVEGVLAELDDGPRGRAAVLQIEGDKESFGLLAVYKEGAEWEAVAVDLQGKARPELAQRLISKDLELEHVDARKWTSQSNWPKVVDKLLSALPKRDAPQAVAAFRVRGPKRVKRG